MTFPLFSRIPILAIAAFLFGGAIPLPAQVNTEFQITKIDPQISSTPSVTYSLGLQKAAGQAKNWIVIEVIFTWKPRLSTEKFADDATFNYYVLLNNKSPTNPQGTLLVGQVTHINIPANQNDLKSVMYISPRTLERFFDGTIPSNPSSALVDVGITITRQGQIVATKSLRSTSGDWWPQYQQTSGYLLNKNETPFAPLYWDYYEAIKKP